MRGVLESLKRDRTVVITPDGPRGPRRRVKKAISRIALAREIPVVPATLSCSSCWRIHKSWDQMLIPKPFARVTLHLLPALYPVQGDKQGFERTLQEVLQNNDMAS